MATVEPSVVQGEGSDNSVVTEVDTVVTEVDTVVTFTVEATMAPTVLSWVMDEDFVATDEDADPIGGVSSVGLKPRISHLADHIFGVLGGDAMFCFRIATFLPTRERLQKGFRFRFQFELGGRFRFQREARELELADRGLKRRRSASQ